ncbi:acetylornithine deacetylase [uncultured Roseobacter sp.]|uniref:acetylornithine deacetylase n=1 Tax=uncultured Roseobacter sp. TaxID=114847 RepID=UPI0026209B6D|nr:acetylornithine deacetylase [uncultured Roseobacter sp.]
MTRTLALLERLIAFPTVSQASNLDLIDWAQDLLATAGFTVTRLPSPCGTKAGLHARIGPAVPGGICLSGHTDVVPTEGQAWTRPAFTLTQEGARVFGRGTTDMKGFVASALALAERIGQVALQQPLTLVLSYDEEIGCVGLHKMLPALIPLLGAPRLVIVGEPTAMQMATGHKGKVSLQVTCRGEAGHSALAPNFLNAIHVASEFIAGTRSLQETLAQGAQDPAFDIPYTTLHIGKIHGGRALNIVPDLVTLEMEFRHLAVTPATKVLDAIRSLGRRIEAEQGRSDLIDITQTGAYPGLNQHLGPDSIACVAALLEGAEPRHVAFGTEAGYFAQIGLETVVIGPGDMASDGHKPDEGLDLAQLAACDRMMTRIEAQLSGDG